MLNSNKSRAVVAGLVLGVVLIVLISWRMASGPEMGGPPPSTVETVTAAAREVQVTVAALGSLDAAQSIVVRSEIASVEERSVGKECVCTGRSRGWPYHKKKNTY